MEASETVERLSHLIKDFELLSVNKDDYKDVEALRAAGEAVELFEKAKKQLKGHCFCCKNRERVAKCLCFMDCVDCYVKDCSCCGCCYGSRFAWDPDAEL